MTTAESGDNARECLEDVVSHFDSLRAGLCAQRAVSFEASDADCIAYWNHEIAALERMKSQAQAALAVTVPQDGGGECARFEAWFEQNKVHAHGWSPRYAAIEGWQAALAQKAVPVAVEVVRVITCPRCRGTGYHYEWCIDKPPTPIASASEAVLSEMRIEAITYDEYSKRQGHESDFDCILKTVKRCLGFDSEPRNVEGMTRAEFEAHLRICYQHDNVRAHINAPDFSLTEDQNRSISERVELNYPAVVDCPGCKAWDSGASEVSFVQGCEGCRARMRKANGIDDATHPAAAQPVAQTAECSVASDCKWPSCRRDCVIRTDAAAQPSRAEVLTDDEILKLAARVLGNPLLFEDLKQDFTVHTEAGDWIKFARALKVKP